MGHKHTHSLLIVLLILFLYITHVSTTPVTTTINGMKHYLMYLPAKTASFKNSI